MSPAAVAVRSTPQVAERRLPARARVPPSAVFDDKHVDGSAAAGEACAGVFANR